MTNLWTHALPLVGSLRAQESKMYKWEYKPTLCLSSCFILQIIVISLFYEFCRNLLDLLFQKQILTNSVRLKQGLLTYGRLPDPETLETLLIDCE